MLNTNYHKKLNEIINEDPLSHDFYSHTWDPAHLVELSSEDTINSKKDKSCKFVVQRSDTVSRAHKQVGYGKALEEIREYALQSENPKAKVRVPLTHSTTRWATYATGVYDSFNHNYPYMYDRLNDIGRDELNEIRNVPFVAEVNAIADIYGEISKLSLAVQTPDLYPWQVDQYKENTIRNLTRISDQLSTDKVDLEQMRKILDESGKPLLKRTADMAEEVIPKGTFKGKPLTYDKQFAGASGTRNRNTQNQPDDSLEQSVQRALKRSGHFTEVASKNMQNRFDKNQPKASVEAGELFSMEKILSRQKDEVPDELFVHVSKAKRAGFLEDRFSEEQMKVEYFKFISEVHEECSESYRKEPNVFRKRKLEKQYYERLIKGQYGSKEYPEITHLLAGATLRSSNESQCEGMGSVAGAHSKGRGSLDPVGLSKETFLSWKLIE
jgi:hypothetical protein